MAPRQAATRPISGTKDGPARDHSGQHAHRQRGVRRPSVRAVTRRSNLALRLFVGTSFGNAPTPYYFGGLDTLRGFDFRDFSGDRAAFANIEYRFPLIDYIGTTRFGFQGIRGRVFFDIGAAYYSYSPVNFKFYNSKTKPFQSMDGPRTAGASPSTWRGLDLNWDFAQPYRAPPGTKDDGSRPPSGSARSSSSSPEVIP